MAAVKLLTFKDIYEAVAEEVGVPTSDTTTLNRIKRNINMIYLNEVVPAARWPWLIERTQITHNKQYNDDSSDTASVTNGSTTVTLSSTVTESKAGQIFKTTAHEEYYIIESHTAGTDTLTLSTEYTGDTNASVDFNIWTDKVSLPQDAAETVDIKHSFSSRVLIPRGAQKLDELAQIDFDRVDYPIYYSTDAYENGTTEAARNRFFRLWPSRNDEDITLYVTYKKEVDALDADSDEPLLPLEDRIVLFYGASALSWKRETDTEDSGNSFQLYQNKLQAMLSKWEDSTDMPRLEVDNRYTNYRRNTVWRP